ncbi:PREDICTED: inhibitor of nuclear factor kappa-B kinase subunit beta-like [Branchiostoma belcheri]|uniref:IkappaB kinase n=1 Tax=Branchiostoma belcheri TaxID=7741 RepID=A0A6P4Z119_BRABE|nr:PREDICTED: inhibitor of nuclear factor kappa-B kinase subunit beta-like [Branchiostoma belcheri]
MAQAAMHQFAAPMLMPTPPQLQPPQEIGGWVQDRVLGSGGFGTVTLWRHKESSDTVALKKTRQELNPKNRERWKLEVDIMKRLKHDHVVTAMDVPDPLKPSVDHLPFLAMEFCSGGDLRKVLSRPENYCGMREIDVRNVVRHIASGVEYLHSKRIIHRDLKPENIVLQEEEGGEVVYKLIDLGYAKDLDQGSVCSSFVGTLQYLAPELFASQKYTRTVDYWSFGTLVFECITGSRPFLPNRNPVQWHLEVKRKKQDTHIRAYEERPGEIKLASDIPAPHHLCQPLVERFESWLQLMLRWEPHSRGGGGNNRATCFELLDSILDLKIVHVLDMHTGQLYSYPVEEDETVESLMIRLALETQMPVEQQELMFSTGMSPDPNGKVSQCWDEPGKDDNIVFLFNKNYIDDSKWVVRPLPEVVKVMIAEPHTLQPYPERKKSYGLSYHYCRLMADAYNQLFKGSRASMLNLLRLQNMLTKLVKEISSSFSTYKGQEAHFIASLECDMEKYAEQSTTGITSEKMFRSWRETQKEVEAVTAVHQEEVQKHESASTALQTKLVQPQRSPLARRRQIEELDDIAKQALNLFNELRQTPREERIHYRDSQKMVRVVLNCVTKRDNLVEDIYTHLMKLIELRKEVKELLPNMQRTLKDIEESRKKLTAFQRKRQQDLWTLLKVVLQKVPGNSPDPVPTNPGAMENRSLSSSTSSVSSVYLEKTCEESMVAKSENQDVRGRFSEMFSSIINLESDSLSNTQSLDWSFLEDGKEARDNRDNTPESVEESL